MNPVNGLLLIDKPTGVTSHDVVNKVRRTLGMRGIGHAGTLDPLASGLMVLLIGEATKVSDYLLNGDKGYEVRVKLGTRTDSMDITGLVLEERAVTSTVDEIRAAALSLSGTLELEVPVHSAVKVDGKKLYEFAHKGERPETVPTRSMTFYDIEVIEVSTTDVLVNLKCSKGSFIRAWANHLGAVLGCGGTVQTLRRTFSSPFNVADAMTLERMEKLWSEKSEYHGSAFGPSWVSLRDALPGFRRLDIEGRDEVLLKNGQISNSMQSELLQFVRLGEAMPSVRVISRETNDLLALLLVAPGEFYKIKRVFNRA